MKFLAELFFQLNWFPNLDFDQHDGSELRKLKEPLRMVVIRVLTAGRTFPGLVSESSSITKFQTTMDVDATAPAAQPAVDRPKVGVFAFILTVFDYYLNRPYHFSFEHLSKLGASIV